MAESENSKLDEKKKSSSQEEKGDEDLDELLDNALQDFNKVPNSVTEVEKKEESAENVVADEKWTEEFIKQAATQFEQSMQALLQGGDNSEQFNLEQYTTEFQQIIENATGATEEDVASGISQAISQTLKSLSEDTENLRNQFTEENLLSMLGNMNLDESGEGTGDFLPFMQQMMQSLLSKDILYPALKDIVDKYPEWLQQNKGKISESEHERFSKQAELMSKVCGELEKESESDSSEVKRKRFDIILNLMQKMQDCGQPPQDLVGDLNSIVSFDEQGNPRIPGMDPSKCSVM